MNRWRSFAVVVALVSALMLAGLAMAPPVSAHHAIQAEYEMSKTGAFTGTLTRFAMINPHVRWFFEETKADGTKVGWEMSGAGPGALRAAGLVRIFVVGTKYDVTFAPAKNGANVGRVRTMTSPDGKVVTLFHEDPTNVLNN
ncbi:MAG: hypothetical protein EXQ53_07085 [Acidobacteria bacterium]|nr:hypothetical protein [Acidobacteriota bacterium]